MADDVLQRITGLTIDGFRGFTKRQALDTNADIVLIAGPNGFGKTSLLQALQLLLTGHHDFDDPRALASHVDKGAGEAEGASPTEPRKLRLTAQAEFVSGAEGGGVASCGTRTLQLDWQPLPNTKPEFVSEVTWPRLLDVAGSKPDEAGEVGRQRELLARVTTFYPEQVDELFRSITTGTSLRDIFQPVPNQVSDVLAELEAKKDDIRKRVARVSSWKRTPQELEQDRAEAICKLTEAWKPIADALGVLVSRPLPPPGGRAQKWAPLGATLRVLTELEQQKREVLGRLLATTSLTLEVLREALAGLRTGMHSRRSKIAVELGDTLLDIVRAELARARKESEGVHEKGAELSRRMAELERELQEIEEDHPRLDQYVTCFASDEVLAAQTTQASPAGLLEVLQILAGSTEGWMHRASLLPEEERCKLRFVLAELRQVVPDTALRRAQELEQWLGPLRAAAERRQKVKVERDKVKRELERYGYSERVGQLEAAERALSPGPRRRHFEEEYDKLLGAEMRAERQDEVQALERELQQAEAAVQAAQAALEHATRPTEPIHRAIAAAANHILRRFALVDGVLPVEVTEVERPERQTDEPHTAIATKSGLHLEQLSTGQRAQMAVALAVAQAQLLRKSTVVDLPFHVLLLDDVSTAYDLSNLTREAILWRQLAYTKEPRERWQIFLCSHHEDLTNHLLDLLIPPHGAKLRLLKLTGWSPEQGPKIDSFNVEPSLEIPREEDSPRRRALSEALKEELCPGS